jgi:hypothetical protein
MGAGGTGLVWRQARFGLANSRSRAYNKSFEPTARPLASRRLNSVVCARHGTERARCKSSRQVFAEPKARRRARAPTARWGLEEAQSKRAGRRTGTGYEVWHTRDERARDREVLHPQGVCFINPASMRGTFCVLPWEICRPSQYAGLRAEGSALTDRQKSAEGIVGPPQARLVRHPTAERRGNR